MKEHAQPKAGSCHAALVSCQTTGIWVQCCQMFPTWQIWAPFKKKSADKTKYTCEPNPVA